MTRTSSFLFYSIWWTLTSCAILGDVDPDSDGAATIFPECTGITDGPISKQIAGDCQVLVCGPSGALVSKPSPSDIPDDGNPCTLDDCFGGNPAHTFMQYAPCFAGPIGAAGVGICASGIQQCDEQGHLVGACVGETLPRAEICDAQGQDEDCDGKINEEGSNCFCGDGYVSTDIGETCEDGNSEDGDACSANCREQRVIAIERMNRSECRACAVLSGGKVKCWGYEQTGWEIVGDQATEMGGNLPFENLGADVEIVETANNCAVTADGAVICWGYLYPDGAVKLDFGTNHPVLHISTGDSPEILWQRMCALFANGDVKCWGCYNDAADSSSNETFCRDYSNADNLPAGSLGTGKRAVAMSVGSDHACVILEGGIVKCWGRNDFGQLGLGDTKNRGALPPDMGEFLPAVDLGTNRHAIAISTGTGFTCAILDNGRIKCWGDNSNGVLGLGDVNTRGDSANEMGDNLPTVNVGTGKKAIAISAGHDHACAILEGGSMKCWGRNFYGQLGLGDTQARGASVLHMGDNLPDVKLGTGRTTTAISAGYLSTCVVLDDGSLKCWGNNSGGELGLGDINNRGDESNEMGDNLPRVKLFSDVW